MHTVGTTVEQDLSKGSEVQVGNVTTEISSTYTVASVKIYPNPTTENAASKGLCKYNINSIGVFCASKINTNIRILFSINFET